MEDFEGVAGSCAATLVTASDFALAMGGGNGEIDTLVMLAV